MRFLLSIQERNGYARTLNSKAGGQLTSISDSYGRALTFAYARRMQLPNVFRGNSG